MMYGYLIVSTFHDRRNKQVKKVSCCLCFIFKKKKKQQSVPYRQLATQLSTFRNNMSHKLVHQVCISYYYLKQSLLATDKLLNPNSKYEVKIQLGMSSACCEEVYTVTVCLALPKMIKFKFFVGFFILSRSSQLFQLKMK